MCLRKRKKCKDNFTVTVTYNGVEYPFEFGSQAYIFQTGLYNDIHKNFGMRGLLKYVSVVHDCYVSDTIRTPLGEFADYVAERWISMRKKDRQEILDEFYCYI